ncbi:MAG: 16S rRNA (cytidine(1402)-2'-O)-methyltransferase [Vicinamibacteria bacterium]
MPGTLYVVSTPIGNLADLSLRARDTLSEVDLIACEDTRVTGKLLKRFDVETPLVSYHEHNERERAVDLLARLEEGRNVALVSDAGTPLVSDPGYRLVRAAREAGVEIRAIPGPSAVLAALSISGLPTSRFTFAGFLPPKGKARERAIAEIADIGHTIVLFEAGSRIQRLLTELARALGSRPTTLLRELTKLHEEHREGTLVDLAEWASRRNFKGELTLVLGGKGSELDEPEKTRASLSSLAPRFLELRESGLSARAAAKLLAKEQALSSRDVYNELVGGRKSRERP